MIRCHWYPRMQKKDPPPITGKSANSLKSAPTFSQILEKRYSRRSCLQLLAGTLAAAPGIASVPVTAATNSAADSSLGFREVQRGLDDTVHVADGYECEVLIRWGDPLFDHSPGFDPEVQDARAQLKQFGYNNDYTAFLPIPGESERALLFVNHESTNSRLMYSGAPTQASLDRHRIDVDIAAHGCSVIEIHRQDGRWSVNRSSRFNRRVSPWTPMLFDGPAQGVRKLHSLSCRDGIHSAGTFANCGGGITPWGTVLTAEENIQGYFFGTPDIHQEAEDYRHFGMPLNNNPRFHWGRFHDRWNLEKNPLEPFQAGWIVELDPFNPDSVPVKHTALGRFKHEACSIHLTPAGRVVTYMGDDQHFEHIYRFVSKHTFTPGGDNSHLLSEGILHAAEFRDDGKLIWHPLVHGSGPLTGRNGFYSQADICIYTRRAADLVGATRMDRPEDVDINPLSGEVFVMLTGNSRRSSLQVDAANPRARNRSGHILRLRAPANDHCSDRFDWDLFIMGGNPATSTTKYARGISENGWFVNPDNCAFDHRGRLWIATDGSNKHGHADGLWACDTDGPARALSKHFLRVPRGAEATGPSFSPDYNTLFLSVQHPLSRWPDFEDTVPPRPAVIAVHKSDGGEIGS